jgi:phospholipid/cholesterol/gamma-HCH transport system ATP-binding protein
MSDDPVCSIRIRNLRNVFGAAVVHDGLDLDVRAGEILGVVGSSGSGKTVLLNAILGLRPPDGGTIEIFGENIRAAGAQAMIKRRIGVLFQSAALFSALTVQENVEAPFREQASLPAHVVRDLAALKISLAGLPDDTGAMMPAALSGGMRKRAGIARAIALDPELVLLDEPTSGLDPAGAGAFDDLIRTLHEALGFTVFLITHDLDTLHAICDRVAVLADRKIIAVASVAELERSEDPWIKGYFRGRRGRAAQARDDARDAPNAEAG